MFKNLMRKTEDNVVPSVNDQCSLFEVNNWVISEFILKVLLPKISIRPYPINEIFLIVSAVCRIKPRNIFEWGTHIGVSARIFYETIKYFKINSKIHSIDLPDDVDHIEHPRSRRGILVKNIPEVSLYHGDGLTTSMEIYSKNQLVREASSLFYLDGDHEYDSVIRELSTILQSVPGANFLVHDTFYQSPESGYNTGPFQAIQKLLPGMVLNGYQEISTQTGLPGMTLLYRS